MNLILVNIAGLGIVCLIIWWFWIYKPKQVVFDDNNHRINVENGVYSPAYVKLARGKSQTLTFFRKDASPCAEVVMFPELDVTESLPLNKPVEITIPTDKAGEFDFHCQMKMYKGRVSIE